MSFPRFKFQKTERAAATLATPATFPFPSPSVPSSVAEVASVAGVPPQNTFSAQTKVSPEIDLAAFHERAAIVEYDGSLTRGEADQAAAREMGFDTAEALYRAAIRAWRSEIDATPQTGIPGFDKLAAVSLRFLVSDWATNALAADWDETALFAIHEGLSPKERIDAWGLVPLLAWGVHRCIIEGFSRNDALSERSAAQRFTSHACAATLTEPCLGGGIQQ